MSYWFFNGKDVVSKLDQKPLDKKTNLPHNKTMKNVLFQTGVLLAVNSVRVSQPTFSIFDVTKSLRNLVNSGTFGFSDKQPTTLAGVSTYFVDHQEVKVIFEDLIASGAVKDLTESNNPGGYREFSDTIKQMAPKAVFTKPYIPKPTIVSNTAPASSSVFDAQLNQYVKNRSQSGFTTTMKQIQSRFKGVGFTCDDYVNIVLRLGFMVKRTDLPVSQQYV